MCNILNIISFVKIYTELATVIRLAVVVVFFFFKSGIQMCTTAIILMTRRRGTITNGIKNAFSLMWL